MISPEDWARLAVLTSTGGEAREAVLFTSLGAAREKELLASERAVAVDFAFDTTDLTSFSLSSENAGR